MENLASLTARVTEERRLEECLFCMERFPDFWKRNEMSKFYSCCGKRSCMKCGEAWFEKGGEAALQCPLCRTAFPKTHEEEFARILSRAKSGLAWAQDLAGDYYRKGKGVQADPTEAVRWYEKASNQGWFEASETLGLCYMEGMGVKENLEEARRLLEIAAASKDAKALLGLSCCLDYSDSPDDKKKKVRLLRLAADQGHLKSQMNLAVELESGKGANESSRKEALLLSLKAAEQGHPGAMYNATIMLHELNGDRALPKMLYWLRKASSIESCDPTDAKAVADAKQFLPEFEALVRHNCARCRMQRSIVGKLNICTRCRAIYYCDRECQAAHWKAQHKKDCIPKDIEDCSPEERLSFFAS